MSSGVNIFILRKEESVFFYFNTNMTIFCNLKLKKFICLPLCFVTEIITRLFLAPIVGVQAMVSIFKTVFKVYSIFLLSRLVLNNLLYFQDHIFIFAKYDIFIYYIQLAISVCSFLPVIHLDNSRISFCCYYLEKSTSCGKVVCLTVHLLTLF